MVCKRCGEKRLAFLTESGFCKACNKDMFDKNIPVPNFIPPIQQPVQYPQAQVIQPQMPTDDGTIPKKLAAAEVISKLSRTVTLSAINMIGSFVIVGGMIFNSLIGEGIMLAVIITNGIFYLKNMQERKFLSMKYGILQNKMNPMNNAR